MTSTGYCVSGKIHEYLKICDNYSSVKVLHSRPIFILFQDVQNTFRQKTQWISVKKLLSKPISWKSWLFKWISTCCRTSWWRRSSPTRTRTRTGSSHMTSSPAPSMTSSSKTSSSMTSSSVTSSSMTSSSVMSSSMTSSSMISSSMTNPLALENFFLTSKCSQHHALHRYQSQLQKISNLIYWWNYLV